MNSFCETTTVLHSPWFWYLVVEVLIGAFAIFLIINFGKLLIHTKEKSLMWIFSILMSIVFFIIFSGIILVVFFLLWFHDDHPPSVDYHDLNAAIKNTCFLDPQRQHCPRTVTDLINIEPDHFNQLTQNANLTYQYYPETNQYTLIIRNNTYWKDDYRVVIFDSRLPTVKNYGTGLDFVDADIITCNGKYILKNPPPLPGPWDHIK